VAAEFEHGGVAVGDDVGAAEAGGLCHIESWGSEFENRVYEYRIDACELMMDALEEEEGVRSALYIRKTSHFSVSAGRK